MLRWMCVCSTCVYVVFSVLFPFVVFCCHLALTWLFFLLPLMHFLSSFRLLQTEPQHSADDDSDDDDSDDDDSDSEDGEDDDSDGEDRSGETKKSNSEVRA